jgi:hypothetical protein
MAVPADQHHHNLNISCHSSWLFPTQMPAQATLLSNIIITPGNSIIPEQQTCEPFYKAPMVVYDN